MTPLLHTTVVEGAEPGPTVVFLHGILGSGRNWRGFARRAVAQRPCWRALLPDLRNHGRSGARPPPHDLEACAADVLAVIEDAGGADLVVGHSFGGKVALLVGRALGIEAWALDSPLGTSSGRQLGVVRVLDAIAASPVPAPNRAAVGAHLARLGLEPRAVAWLLTSLHRGPRGLCWVYELDGVRSMLDAYGAADLWPLVDGSGPPIALVRAQRSSAWSPEEEARLAAVGRAGHAAVHALPDAGHWLHIDDPEGLWALLHTALRSAEH